MPLSGSIYSNEITVEYVLWGKKGEIYEPTPASHIEGKMTDGNQALK